MSRLKSMTPIQMVFGLAALLIPFVMVAALIVGTPLLPLLATCLCFFLLGAAMARSQENLVPIGAAIALIGQAIAFTAAFQGHSWQIDSHMMFFALLACLVILRSIPALVVATALIALHHLSLTVLLPSLIYPSADFIINLERTVFHAVIVLMETAALVATVQRLNRVSAEMLAQTEALEDSLKDADRAQQEALRSKERAETAQQQALDAQKAAETALEQARKADEVRAASEHEKEKSDEERRNNDAAKAREQTHIVDTIRQSLTRLEGGDLTTRITEVFPKEYESLRTEFNAAMRTLEELVSVVAQRSEQMDAEISEISLATDDLARRSDAQARNLTKTSAALDGLTKSVRDNAASVDDAHNTAKSAQSNAQVSGNVVSKASQAMGAIKTEAGEIGKIVDLIEGISFQTNLLALNAGVEAARAGEAGLGFAVVASEVRSLAKRSAESATSIRTLIERSGAEVENGSAQIADTVTSLGSVDAAISEITSKMDMISDSTRSQSDQISSLNASIAEMGEVTQKNAAMFEETSAACANLTNGAKALRELTQRFVVSDQEKRSDKVA
ncbi:methyl-accepting chemotaxis protein [uncultured Tateyamaria sp.]|uniref:methyl-accepting chemotaxis protein n=1 Tax=uncultured Tateyamaria sp. TaxID=455651 RepID=UPI00261F1125|nr:methyl-accepting chemotaxis protein [uncultured Tateyamaria sp.]